MNIIGNKWNNDTGSDKIVEKEINENGQKYLNKVRTKSCPRGFYSSGSLECFECHEECIEWNGPSKNDCTVCNFPKMYLFNGVWVDNWDDDLYDYDLNTYSWESKLTYDSAIISSKPEWQTSSLYSKDNLQVSIKKYQTYSSSGNLESGYLKMIIINMRGNITSTKFIQIDPIPDPNDPLTNIFPLISGATNQYQNETDIVDINPDTFNNYAEGTFFEVKAEVTNDWGDKAISFITFAKEYSPTVGDVAITWPSTPWRVHENIQIDLIGNWYNQDVGNFDLFISVKIELPTGDIVVVQINEFQKSAFNFTLPVVSSSSNDNLSVNILLTAINQYEMWTTLNKTLIINNTLTSDFRNNLYDTGMNLSDYTQIAFLSSQMRATLNPLSKGIEDQNIWEIDSDWSGNGEWILNGAHNICEWNQGFEGINWIFTSQEFSTLQDLVGTAILNIANELNWKSLTLKIEFDDLFLVFSNLLMRPELIEYSKIQSIITLLSKLARTELTSLNLSEEFYISCLNSASFVLTRIKYEYNYNLPKEKGNSYENKLQSLRSKERTLWLIAERMFVFNKR